MNQEEMTRRRLLKTGALAAVFAGGAKAQTRQERGRQLVEEALAALGGDSFLNIRNQVTHGRAYSFYNAAVRGFARITVYERFEPMQPDADRNWLPVSRREVYTEKGDYYALFLNGEGWEVTFRGARPQPLDLMQRYRLGTRRDFFYFLRYRLNEPGLYYYHVGSEVVDNMPTEAVQITDAEGEQITIYFKRSDGLPYQALYLRRDPQTRVPFEEKSIWSKYRPFEQTVLPWNIRRERDGVKIFEQFASSVVINQDLDPSLFSLPMKVPVLPPAK